MLDHVQFMPETLMEGKVCPEMYFFPSCSSENSPLAKCPFSLVLNLTSALRKFW